MHLKKANIAPYTHKKKTKKENSLIICSTYRCFPRLHILSVHIFFSLYMHAALSAPYEQFYSLFLFFSCLFT